MTKTKRFSLITLAILSILCFTMLFATNNKKAEAVSSLTLNGYTFASPFGWDITAYTQSDNNIVSTTGGAWQNYLTTKLNTGTQNYYYKLTFNSTKAYTSGNTSEGIYFGICLYIGSNAYTDCTKDHLSVALKWNYDENSPTHTALHEVCFCNAFITEGSIWDDRWQTFEQGTPASYVPTDTITVEVYKIHGSSYDTYAIVTGGKTFAYNLTNSVTDTTTEHTVGFYMLHENPASGYGTLTASNYVPCTDSSYQETNLTVNGSVPETGVKNTAVTLPTATITGKFSTSNSVTPTVTHLGQNVTVSGNSFTPTTAGRYDVTYYGTDAFGISRSKTYYVQVAESSNTSNYTVNFNSNGGSGTMNAQTISVGAETNLNANQFTKSNYTFGGWSTIQNGPAEYSDGQSVKDIVAGGNSVTLYAVWFSANTNYYIVYDGNGATSGTMSNSIATVGSAISLKSNMYAKTGYNFGGWATTSTGTATYTDGQSVTNLASAGGTKTLYAVWNPYTYTIAFNNNGGSGSMSNLSAKVGSSITLTTNTFTKEGYKFSGWATTSTGAVAYSNGASVKDLSTTDKATVTLYAVWAQCQYTIIYNGNGATSGAMANSTVNVGDNFNLTTSTFVKANNTFKGWATTENGEVTYTDGQQVKNIASANSSITLYAVWEQDTYTIAFNNNTGVGEMANLTCNCGENVNLTTNTFTKEGYKFIGWAESTTGEVVYTNGQQVKDLVLKGETKTLYAIWEEVVVPSNSYTLKYNGNGATSGAMGDEYPEIGQSFTLTACGYAKTGYTFKGWAITESGEVVYTDGATITTDLASKDEVATLYAVWEKNATPDPDPSTKTYTITFKANGGDGTMEKLTATVGQKITLTANTFTRDGYTFKGWALTAKGEVKYQDAEEVTDITTKSAITLYAVWEATEGANTSGGGCGANANITLPIFSILIMVGSYLIIKRLKKED